MPRKPSKKVPAQRSIVTTKAADYRTYYANNIAVQVTPWEFDLRFGRVMKATSEKLEIEESCQIYVTPELVKVIIETLSQTLRQYEQMNGPVRIIEVLRQLPTVSSGPKPPSEQ